jgi:hypothetical protein
MRKLTICGGGNAAHVMIALAGQAGWGVDVFTPLKDEVERLQAGVKLRGGIVARTQDREIVGTPGCISSQPQDVIPGSELILLSLPAFAHGPTLCAIADYLDVGVKLGTLPARSGFDYQTYRLLDIVRLSPVIFGLQTLPWACRIVEYGQVVEILGTKARVDIAAAPASAVSQVITLLDFIPDVEFVPVSSLLTLTLANTGQLIHPGILYGLCHGRETNRYDKDHIPLFYQGVDDFTAGVLQAMSDEVQAVTEVVGEGLPGFNKAEVTTLYGWLLRSYPDIAKSHITLRDAFVSNRAYAGLKMPVRCDEAGMYRVDFKARYLAEDVPFGLVVLRGIAELVGVPTPTIDRVIIWAQAQLGRSYLENGRLCGADLAETRAPQVFGIQQLQQLA